MLQSLFLLNSSTGSLRVINKLFELFTENGTHSSIWVSQYYHQFPLQSTKRNRHFWVMIHLIFSSNPLRRRWLVSCKCLFLSAEKAQNLGMSRTLMRLLQASMKKSSECQRIRTLMNFWKRSFCGQHVCPGKYKKLI